MERGQLSLGSNLMPQDPYVKDMGGLMWVSDMLLPHDPNIVMMDTPSQSSFFSESPHPFDEMRDRVGGLDMDGFMMLDEFDTYCESQPQYMSTASAATQTPSQRARKIKPVKHPALKLKTPIAYQKDTDLSVIPIQKDGMAVCQTCGAIGVKHAFYTKERRFCSLSCARQYAELEKSGQPIPKPLPVFHFERMEETKSISPETLNSNSSVTPLPLAITLDEPMDPPLKRNRAEIPNTYEWKNQLSEPGFIAAPVSCFKHAPIYECWDNITVGMKVEVENTDCDNFSESFPDSFWVATVLKIAGYKALLRYEGFGQNGSKDFWLNLCCNTVHPVGWCATRGKPLIPPKTIQDKYKDWKEFLVKRLTGARTLPSNFSTKIEDSLISRFRCGMNLEVVDKNRISRMKVARIEKIVGKRLHVKYYQAEQDDNGFWCHEDSPLIHPCGWSERVGHCISAHRSYMERCISGNLHEDDATEEYFITPRTIHYPPDIEFREGMKLEAVDPLNLSSICVATVMKVLKEGYIMIRIDSYDADESGADWFCYHSSSPCIFPAGFCDTNSIPLTPPKGYDPSEFDWETYLRENNLETVPLALFNREVPAHGFVVGMRLEAADLMDPRLVCVGTVSRVVGRLLKVHFDGWEEEYDQWLDCESPDVYPVGWCELVGQKLEGPRVTPKANAATGKTPKGVRKKPRRRHKRTAITGGKTSPAGSLTGGSPPGGRRGPTSSPATLSADIGLIAQQHSASNPVPSTAVAPVTAATVMSTPIHMQTMPAAVTSAMPERDRLPFREPAQATKLSIDPLTGEGASLSREPETAQEPAGPDQSLPVPSEPRQPVPMAPSGGQNHPRSTSYVSTTSSSTKLIPRLVDANSPSEPGELAPAQWDVCDVAQFLRVNDCAAYCESFSKQKIDGVKLLSLTKDQIIELTGLKVGPSLKIYDMIQQLKIKVNPAQERLKASLKKLL
ncbi:polycomb protein Sfmbt isoform X1 [Schistocerca piceifrons]|uniref:polycomb protein Sfmbt isoform X1 n=2 Tax=Schistocerca piceifrons TaxID=274613 RepID=UPI001F5E8602|nr:polycomb protein Sfmbt isoform X1 [Schistocerca piceifrons]